MKSINLYEFSIRGEKKFPLIDEEKTKETSLYDITC
jgi:hypothetical protein